MIQDKNEPIFFKIKELKVPIGALNKKKPKNKPMSTRVLNLPNFQYAGARVSQAEEILQAEEFEAEAEAEAEEIPEELQLRAEEEAEELQVEQEVEIPEELQLRAEEAEQEVEIPEELQLIPEEAEEAEEAEAEISFSEAEESEAEESGISFSDSEAEEEISDIDSDFDPTELDVDPEFGILEESQIGIQVQETGVIPSSEATQNDPFELTETFTVSQMINPQEVPVILDLIINPNLKFKTQRDYLFLSSQDQLKASYVPRSVGKKLDFTQSWLLPTLSETTPLPNSETENFWNKLELVKNTGKSMPITSQEINESLVAYPETNTPNFWVETGSNTNSYRVLSLPSKPDLKKGQIYIGLPKNREKSVKVAIETRTLGPVPLVVEGTLGLTQLTLQTPGYNLQKIDMVDEPVRQTKLDYLLNATTKTSKPSISGSHVGLRGFLKLPVGFEPVSFYSNYSVSEGTGVGTSAKLPKSPQTIVKYEVSTNPSPDTLNEKYSQLIPENVEEIVDLFEPLVLEPSKYLDLPQINQLLAYFDLDLKSLTNENMENLAQRVASKENANSLPADFTPVLEAYRKPLKTVLPYFPEMGSTDQLKIPQYLVWNHLHDSLTQGDQFYLERSLKSLREMPDDLSGFNVELDNIPDYQISGNDLPNEYRGLIINFPANPTKPDDLNNTLVWAAHLDHYLPHRPFQAEMVRWIRESRTVPINKFVKEEYEQFRPETIQKLEQAIKTLGENRDYFQFQRSILASYPREQVLSVPLPPKHKKIRQVASPELIRIASVVNRQPEFQRLAYLRQQLSKYHINQKNGRVTDSLGRYICCWHVISWITYGPSRTIPHFLASNDNKCRYCGLELVEEEMDSTSDYIGGQREEHRTVIFRQETDLNLMRKSNELPVYLRFRFLDTALSVVDGLELAPQEEYAMYEEFIGHIMGRLLPSSEEITYKNHWGQLGLKGDKWGKSLFYQPDIDLYQYLKGDYHWKWWKTIYQLLESTNISEDILPEQSDILLKDAKKVFVGRLIHSARSALATVLFYNRVVLQIRERQIDNLLKILTEMVYSNLSRNYYRITNVRHSPRIHDPIKSSVKEPKFLSSEETESLMSKLVAPQPEDLFDEKNGKLRYQLPETSPTVENSDKTASQEYWVLVYLKMVPVFFNILGQQSPETQEEIGSQLDLRVPIPEVTDPADPSYCRYLGQVKYQTLARLYQLFDQVTVNIKSLNSDQSDKNPCKGVRSAKDVCHINDNFYYITRLIRGEISDQNLDELIQIIMRYEKAPEFQEEFLKLISKPEEEKEVQELPEEESQELPEEEDLLTQIKTTFQKYREVSSQFDQCYIQNNQLHQVMPHGPYRSVPPIEWPLEYQFLLKENEDSRSFIDLKLDIQLDTQLPEWSGQLFQDLLKKSNEKTLYYQDNSDLKKILRPAMSYMNMNQRSHGQISDPDAVIELNQFIKGMGVPDLQSEKEYLEKSQYLKNPDPFHIWWRTLNPELSIQQAKSQWLSLSQDEQDYWKLQSRISPVEANPCLESVRKPSKSDILWDQAQIIASYLVFFREYQFNFRNTLNQKESDIPFQKIDSPESDSLMMVPEELLVLVKDVSLQRNSMKSFFSPTSTIKIVEYPGPARISDQEIIFETTCTQIKALFHEVFYQSTREETQPEGILGNDIWELIDCINVNEDQVSETPTEEQYEGLVEILKYLLLRDTLENYQRSKDPDKPSYLKLLQMAWLQIAKMETALKTPTSYIDYAIKYGFYERHQEFIKKMAEFSKKSRKDLFEEVSLEMFTKDTADGLGNMDFSERPSTEVGVNPDYENDEDDYGDTPEDNTVVSDEETDDGRVGDEEYFENRIDTGYQD